MAAGSLLNDLPTNPARALTVLGALQNHEEGRGKVKALPTWVNLSHDAEEAEQETRSEASR